MKVHSSNIVKDSKDQAFNFAILRAKWHEVPAGDTRVTTTQILSMSDNDLLEYWEKMRFGAISGNSFNVRGWYHQLYSDILSGKRVMDVGSGLGIDGISFAQAGAEITLVDIVESNLQVLQRICQILDLKDVEFLHLKDLDSLAVLRTDYEVIWCQGSLINAPFEFMRQEVEALLQHLPVGGRWIELAYPKERWIREGQMPFEQWGDRTDGGAPWMEWYDLEKLLARQAPAHFEPILYFNFHNDDFNWFDLVRRA